MLELEITGHIKREGKVFSGFALHCLSFPFPPIFLPSFFMQLCLKIHNLLAGVLGMLPGMAVDLGI